MSETTETQDHDFDVYERARREAELWGDRVKAAELEGERVAKILIERFKKDVEEALREHKEEGESSAEGDAESD